METVNEYVDHESDENSSTDDDDDDEDNEQIHECVRDGAQYYVSDEDDVVSGVSVPKSSSAQALAVVLNMLQSLMSLILQKTDRRIIVFIVLMKFLELVPVIHRNSKM